MKDGFIKVGTCSPKIHLADPKYNADMIISAIKKADEMGVKLIAFPELAITGYTCGDLFMHDMLLDTVEDELIRITRETKECRLVAVVGAPIRSCGKLYNSAVVISRGKIIAAVPKRNMPNYGEFCELRYFAVPDEKTNQCNDRLDCCLVSPDTVFACYDYIDFKFGVEICGDMWAEGSPSDRLARNGAVIIVNCSAEDEIIGRADNRKLNAAVQSARTLSAYMYCNAGDGESTTDMVFSGHSFIYEYGNLLAEREPFADTGDILVTEIDIGRLLYERRRVNGFSTTGYSDSYAFSLGYGREEACGFTASCKRSELPETELTRIFSRNPFVPNDRDELYSRANDILMLQAMGLKHRLEHTHSRSIVLGISGGLDSGLALLVAVKVCDLMGVGREFVHAITMPCFGTTEHTKSNAVELCEALGVTLHTIPVGTAVKQHFADIGHDESDHGVVYENAQARMRTLVLMDFANKTNGLVVGTGDLSELALGWATYNGDHMSMYGVNAGIPKTLIRHVVRYYADTCGNDRIKNVLISILDTPISPELLPADDKGNIAQKTEDLVGPYELHDFFLYYVLRWGYAPAKLYRVAKLAFDGSEFSDRVILKWLKNFYRRFFNQQFKRSCLPDGPKIGSVGLSPRGDWHMPSDANYRIWQDELNSLE